MDNKLTFLSRIILILFLSPASFASLLNDHGKISPTQVSRVVSIKSEADILAAIDQANKEHLPIAIMGKQYSQGGQSLAPQAIELNMLPLHNVLSLDRPKKQVTVQSGITWADLQYTINQDNLAIKSMQSPNIFTVGGSMSVNAHGDDFRSGAVGNSIVAFHLLLANGNKVLVTPETEPALWTAVIGGYGLLGVVTDVTLQLTDNSVLKGNYQELDVAKFPRYFHEKIINNKNIVLFYSHLNIVPGTDFLQNMYVITYTDTHKLPDKIIALDNPDQWNQLLTPLFNISRHGSLGKAWRWELEKKLFSVFYNNRVITRNNAMEKPVRFASEHRGKDNVDWLQEYFIPTDNLSPFMDKLRLIMRGNKVNLLNVTVRYVPAEANSRLTYAKTNCFAVVLYFNQRLSVDELKRAQSWTRDLIDAALSVGGNYYLPYQSFASKKQFHAGYPGVGEFLKIKQQYDPSGLFNNKLYQHYFLD